MIKYDSKTKECIIKGNEDDILDEFGVIVYGLRKAKYSEDDICRIIAQVFAKFDIDNGRRKNK